jgi:hypothetical protein
MRHALVVDHNESTETGASNFVPIAGKVTFGDGDDDDDPRAGDREPRHPRPGDTGDAKLTVEGDTTN